MKKMRVGVDLFCGAGGLSLGAEMAGIKIISAVENDKYSVETYKKNHPDVLVFDRDIRRISPKETSKKNPFIVFGGPPCQGFSFSNKQTRTTKNKKNSLFSEFVRFVKELEPSWFLFENVEGIIDFNKGKTLKTIKSNFEKIGYTIEEGVLSASDYGVPQNRNRYFLVGNKHCIKFKFPQKKNEKISVWESISDLPLLTNGADFEKLPYKKRNSEISAYARLMRRKSKFSLQNQVTKNEDYVIERYKYIKQGQNWKAIPPRLMKNYKELENCHSGIYRRLKATEPATVISNYRKNMLIHPFQNRGLSIREAARIQSFPDNFIFKGTKWFIQQQIGNAVPPLMAKAIFRKIILSSKSLK